MDLSAGTGLWKAIKGGSKLTLNALTGPIGAAIGGILAAFIEMVTKFFWRRYEVKMINEFILDAKAFIKTNGVDKFSWSDDFVEWYRYYVQRVPAIACVTLNSGIGGSWMHFINPFESKIDANAAFAKGTKYLTRIKQNANWYQKETGLFFNSLSDPHTDALLKKAKDYGKGTGLAAEQFGKFKPVTIYNADFVKDCVRIGLTK